MAREIPPRRKPPDQAIVEMIKRNIQEMVWLPGDRLPTERELAETFGSSRNTLRRGLKLLEVEGVITRHVGRGSFVSKALDLENAGLAGTASGSRSVDRSKLWDFVRRASPLEIMEVRSMIEPAAAAMAAARATREDINLMERHLREARDAEDFDKFEETDAILHMRIVLSTRNRLLSDIYSEIGTARIEPAWKNLKRRRLTNPQRARYHAEHHGIIRAIAERDGELARDLSHNHLREVMKDLGLEL